GDGDIDSPGALGRGGGGDLSTGHDGDVRGGVAAEVDIAGSGEGGPGDRDDGSAAGRPCGRGDRGDRGDWQVAEVICGDRRAEPAWRGDADVDGGRSLGRGGGGDLGVGDDGERGGLIAEAYGGSAGQARAGNGDRVAAAGRAGGGADLGHGRDGQIAELVGGYHRAGPAGGRNRDVGRAGRVRRGGSGELSVRDHGEMGRGSAAEADSGRAGESRPGHGDCGAA